MLKEICEMMSDYEDAVDRDSEFKYSKYIIVTKVEKAETNLSEDWEGKIVTLKNQVQSMVNDLKKE